MAGRRTAATPQVVVNDCTMARSHLVTALDEQLHARWWMPVNCPVRGPRRVITGTRDSCEARPVIDPRAAAISCRDLGVPKDRRG